MFCGVGVKKSDDDTCQENKKIQNYFYKPSHKIGEGNFSQVFKGVDQTTGMHVAIKVIKYSSLTTKVAEQLLKNQVAILKELNHENVLKCHDVYSSKNNCYIVTEFYDGGDLEKILFRNKCFHEKDITRIIYQVYKGLLYLNQHNIVHRDFKPANIFLTSNGTPKIADFGFAIKSSKPFKDISIGSPIYMSPQGLLLHEYGPKTEVWAFGIMIYQLLHGETPLSRCKDQKELKQKILLPPVYRDGISVQLRKMIEVCLTVDPKHRIDMKQIATTLYMSKLIYEFKDSKLKDLSSTYHTTETITQKALQFVQKVKVYDEGLALLQYCRLIHKTSQQTPSSILSQWLLNLCWNLQKVRLQGGEHERNENLVKTIHDYFVKYHKEHKDSHLNVSCEDVIAECHKLLGKLQNSINTSILKTKQNNLTMLLRETQMLQKYGSTNKLGTYAKATQVEKYLDALKNAKNSTQSNQFIFNK